MIVSTDSDRFSSSKIKNKIHCDKILVNQPNMNHTLDFLIRFSFHIKVKKMGNLSLLEHLTKIEIATDCASAEGLSLLATSRMSR